MTWPVAERLQCVAACWRLSEYGQSRVRTTKLLVTSGARPRLGGVRDVLIVCCDGLTGFPEAIQATWPLATDTNAWEPVKSITIEEV